MTMEEQALEIIQYEHMNRALNWAFKNREPTKMHLQVSRCSSVIGTGDNFIIRTKYIQKKPTDMPVQINEFQLDAYFTK